MRVLVAIKKPVNAGRILWALEPWLTATEARVDLMLLVPPSGLEAAIEDLEPVMAARKACEEAARRRVLVPLHRVVPPERARLLVRYGSPVTQVVEVCGHYDAVAVAAPGPHTEDDAWDLAVMLGVARDAGVVVFVVPATPEG